jgi:hypothetical protein
MPPARANRLQKETASGNLIMSVDVSERDAYCLEIAHDRWLIQVDTAVSIRDAYSWPGNGHMIVIVIEEFRKNYCHRGL